MEKFTNEGSPTWAVITDLNPVASSQDIDSEYQITIEGIGGTGAKSSGLVNVISF